MSQGVSSPNSNNKFKNDLPPELLYTIRDTDIT